MSGRLLLFAARALELKEDVLRCTTTELSYGLSRFAVEVKRPNGEPYLPDSLFYLCLGIQQVRHPPHVPGGGGGGREGGCET